MQVVLNLYNVHYIQTILNLFEKVDSLKTGNNLPRTVRYAVNPSLISN